MLEGALIAAWAVGADRIYLYMRDEYPAVLEILAREIAALGQIVLLGFTWALFHHLFGGIRHFIWDTGRGMDHPEREYLAQATWIGGLALTVVVWVVAYMVR